MTLSSTPTTSTPLPTGTATATQTTDLNAYPDVQVHANAYEDGDREAERDGKDSMTGGAQEGKEGQEGQEGRDFHRKVLERRIEGGGRGGGGGGGAEG